MLSWLLVFLGGGAGAVARYGAGSAWLRLAGPQHPWAATLLINTAGGLAMGALVALLALRGGAAGGSAERWRLLLGVGVLGGFTTYSTFSLETAGMVLRRAYGLAAGYALASVVLTTGACLLAVIVLRRPA